MIAGYVLSIGRAWDYVQATYHPTLSRGAQEALMRYYELQASCVIIYKNILIAH
jgi:hypothetical protein